MMEAAGEELMKIWGGPEEPHKVQLWSFISFILIFSCINKILCEGGWGVG